MCSMIASAAWRSLIRDTRRPHEPTVGLMTHGYPTRSTASNADSLDNATIVRGEGTPAPSSASVVRSLSEHSSIVSAGFTQRTPYDSMIRTAFSELVRLSERSMRRSYSRQRPGSPRSKTGSRRSMVSAVKPRRSIASRTSRSSTRRRV
ncbi:MAG: hypothetical protein R3B57_08440 [Phycisphaerales bacterium]